jgi:7-cyano-7-deazaguanine synthase in queuosine biosynthesis
MHKLAIMMSGGLDSFIGYDYALLELGYKEGEVLPIWVDIGQPYAGKEFAAINRFSFRKRIRVIHCNIMHEKWGNLPTEENQTIPGRNALLAHIGAFFSQRVWVGSLGGETYPEGPCDSTLRPGSADNCPHFYAAGSEWFSTMMERPTVLETPFDGHNKTELVAWALENGITADEMKATSTCYHGSELRCGCCSACFKRWVAFTNNSIEERCSREPWKSKIAQKLLHSYRQAKMHGDFRRYSERRVEETFRAMETVT